MNGLNRRQVCQAGLATVVGGGLHLLLAERAAGAPGKVVVKYDWLISNGQIGDIVAVEKGFFEEAGLAVEFSPGGPNTATVPAVIAGSAQLGQFSEAAQLFNARAGGVPIKILACGYAKGPYAFTSLPKAPVRTPNDFIGKRIGVQPTARFLVEAIAQRNNIDSRDFRIVNVGFDKAPLIRGEVDAIGGWITNTQALSVIGDDRIDVLASDLGFATYANVYFATDRAIAQSAETLAAFVGASARGWAYAHANPEDATRIAVAAYPALDLEWELKTIDLVLKLSFDDNTEVNGWGHFDPAELDRQLATYDAIGQYRRGRPKVDDVYTDKILALTSEIRPRLGAPST